jgi:osmotically-inducible protein OsmY
MYPPESSTAFTDSPDLVLQIERALEKNEQTRGAALDILARGGTVILMGRANAECQVAAERVARTVPGVTEVENHIEIEQ